MPPQKAERDPWLHSGSSPGTSSRSTTATGAATPTCCSTRRTRSATCRPRTSSRATASTATPRSCRSTGSSGRRRRRRPARPSRSRRASRRSASMSYWDAHKLLEQLTGGKAHPVSCVDCHDPKTMELRVTRPGLHHRHPEARRLRRATCRTCPSIERWRKGDRARPTTRTSTRPGRRSAPTCAASATSSTSAARA